MAAAAQEPLRLLTRCDAPVSGVHLQGGERGAGGCCADISGVWRSRKRCQRPRCHEQQPHQCRGSRRWSSQQRRCRQRLLGRGLGSSRRGPSRWAHYESVSSQQAPDGAHRFRRGRGSPLGHFGTGDGSGAICHSVCGDLSDGSGRLGRVARTDPGDGRPPSQVGIRPCQGAAPRRRCDLRHRRSGRKQRRKRRRRRGRRRRRRRRPWQGQVREGVASGLRARRQATASGLLQPS
mmetsp:Transcript_32657/g.86377  ORF Transcript_32657/g.86377 Transcript_32657/m.86377 type:complete len:235 (-) Transcript_32657:307-1011(-)